MDQGEEMSICPKCGAALKVENLPAKTAPLAQYRAEEADENLNEEPSNKFNQLKPLLQCAPLFSTFKQHL